jgi:hypothetical protein
LFRLVCRNPKPVFMSTPFISTTIKTSYCRLLLVAISFVFAPQFVSAQYLPPAAQAKANVRLANEKGKNIQLKTLLANPKLVSAKASCQVANFSISFLPEGGELYGPFRTEGAMISDKHLNYLKAHAEYNIKIFIEHIHMTCNGKDVTELPIIVTCFQ